MFLIRVNIIQTLLGEDQILSASAVSPSRCPMSSDDSDCSKMERPSPVSVLEPLFTDDDISPASTISQPGKIMDKESRVSYYDFCFYFSH